MNTKTMTPKEKAEELVIKMYQPLSASKEVEKGKEHLYYNQYNAAKKCALIAVEEIIKVIDPDTQFKTWMHYKEIKKEIENITEKYE
jgi:hypothetical protein